MKGLILYFIVFVLSGCATGWNSIKTYLPPYQFIGIDGNCRQVKFNFDSDKIVKNIGSAKEIKVCWLAGSFNNWAMSKSNPVYYYGGPWQDYLIIMELDTVASYWVVVLPLPPGRYIYKYIVNNYDWIYDDATELYNDGFGGYCSIITVPSFTAEEIEKYQIDTNYLKIK
ncbi:MAG: hypothetical protein A2Y33_05355 [Spirochaetes bacterium GWF1_51_8]|nr:MAG: hypothetical protein A2Y33_05355 [Spirochaetes bacterium GWF1_51_8]